MLSTTVHRHVLAMLTVGALLPGGTHASSVRLNGHAVRYPVVQSARGTQVLVTAPGGQHTSQLQVAYH